MIRKLIIIILIIVAIPLYIYNTFLIIRGIRGEKPVVEKPLTKVTKKPDLSKQLVQSPRFIEKGKNPFLAYKEKPKAPRKKKKKKVVRIVKTPSKVKPPRITISGIMWNPANPLVMLILADGTSTVVKRGQKVGDGIEVKTIEKNRVQITYQGHSFWLRK